MQPGGESRQRLESMMEDAQKLLTNAAEMKRKLDELTVSTRSEDGFVVATVDARGRLVQLDLDPRIYRSPNAGGLASQIIETYQRAVDKVDTDTRTILERYLPREFDVDQFTNIDFDKYASRRDVADY
ncbi:YbaB/EbfC family nucleoid-associated protein [Actinoplanes sp. NPDC051861]|uniref:YbaB/EbfC family nucleoid-associated protein n=1 Tax=Actinoplanes sp. NPDC051861 TaxID=3155170 RepID=UPI00342316E3